LTPIEVIGRRDNALGTSDAASQGVVNGDDLRERSLLRPADVLESIPGMAVSQHSGDGKANQYWLRGVNLDHGTDFATRLNGVPLNLPTHAHGQGYTDLGILIPELLSRIDYRKGPYDASQGDFSSVGSANLVYRTTLDRPLYQLTLGQRGYVRALTAGSREVADGVTLLTAVERLNNNGPWTIPESMRKLNAQFIWAGGSARQGWTTSVSAYQAQWNSTDQVPQRLLDLGSYQGAPFGRFDSVDPTDGARTQRISLSGDWHQLNDHDMLRLSWYVLHYNLDLWSNFTYSLNRANDQFAQTDQRQVLGGQVAKSWLMDVGETSWINTVGLQLRQDRIRLGLLDSVARRVESVVRDDDVLQTQLGWHAQSEVGWTSWLRTVAGLRFDQFDARVTSVLQPQNSGTSGASIASPKLAVILQPLVQTEIFLNTGRGFHSNDARGTTARVDPGTQLPVTPTPGLTSSQGHEIGLKSQLTPDWLTRWAWWRLDEDSALVYAGDTGNTMAGRPARRDGVEWSQHINWRRHATVEANLAWTRPRFRDADTAGVYIPNAVSKIATLHLMVKGWGDWSGSWGLRYVGSAPLMADNSIRSSSSLTSNLRISRAVSSRVDVSLDCLNLADRRNQDISYVYLSRLATEPAQGVQDIHVHPAQPRTLRMTMRVSL
jgi:outer membrane cobalamin receptor